MDLFRLERKNNKTENLGCFKEIFKLTYLTLISIESFKSYMKMQNKSFFNETKII